MTIKENALKNHMLQKPNFYCIEFRCKAVYLQQPKTGVVYS